MTHVVWLGRRMTKILRYEGSNFFRQRLVLATLSSRPVQISEIRSDADDPGLRGETYEIILPPKLITHCVHCRVRGGLHSPSRQADQRLHNTSQRHRYTYHCSLLHKQFETLLLSFRTLVQGLPSSTDRGCCLAGCWSTTALCRGPSATSWNPSFFWHPSLRSQSR